MSLLLLLTLPAFGAETPDDRPIPTPEETAMTLTIKDNGRELNVAVGDVIAVELESQGGTGYGWYVDSIDEARLKLTDTRTRDISKEGAVGGPVLGVWCFTTTAPGDTELKMLYYRVWEKKESALKSFAVRLHIVDKK